MNRYLYKPYIDRMYNTHHVNGVAMSFNGELIVGRQGLQIPFVEVFANPEVDLDSDLTADDLARVGWKSIRKQLNDDLAAVVELCARFHGQVASLVYLIEGEVHILEANDTHNRKRGLSMWVRVGIAALAGEHQRPGAVRTPLFPFETDLDDLVVDLGNIETGLTIHSSSPVRPALADAMAQSFRETLATPPSLARVAFGIETVEEYTARRDDISNKFGNKRGDE